MGDVVSWVVEDKEGKLRPAAFRVVKELGIVFSFADVYGRFLYAEKSTEELNKRMANSMTLYMYINVHVLSQQLLRVAMNMISAHMTMQVHINGKHLLSGSDWH